MEFASGGWIGRGGYDIGGGGYMCSVFDDVGGICGLEQYGVNV